MLQKLSEDPYGDPLENRRKDPYGILFQKVQKTHMVFFFRRFKRPIWCPSSKCSKDSDGVLLQNVVNLQNIQKTLMVSLRWFLTSSSRVKMQRNAKKTPAAPRKCLKMFEERSKGMHKKYSTNMDGICIFRWQMSQINGTYPLCPIVDRYQMSCPSKKLRNWQG